MVQSASTMKEGITIAVQCHNFQRRFCWMMSSLSQQEEPSLVHVDVAHMRGNGVPTTESICSYYQGRVGGLRRVWWKHFEEFQLRGLIRNRQIKECETKWLLFSDCDMVFQEEFFGKLYRELELNHSKATYMLMFGRTSNPKEQANDMVDKWFVLNGDIHVPNSYERANKLDKQYLGPGGTPYKRPIVSGAGFAQIINMEHCPHGGYYVDPSTNRDWAWNKAANPRSDMQFRARMSKAGGHPQRLSGWFGHNCIHLNHNRDSAGVHLEEQR